MPRWKLVAPHYLNIVPGNGQNPIQWEYVEEDLHAKRTGASPGRPGAGGNNGQRRVRYTVPLMMDPRTPGDWNYPNDEAIIVSTEFSRAFPNDIVFAGEPTPDMVPMDEAAERISASLAHKWVHPIEGMPNADHSTSIITNLERMITGLVKQQGETPEQAMRRATVEGKAFSIPEDMVARSDFEALKAQMEELKAMLTAQMTPEHPVEAEIIAAQANNAEPIRAGRR